MKLTARLLLAGALAASTFAVTTPASACDDPRKGCGGCKLTVVEYLDGSTTRPVWCYS
ncbi:MAG TPA: hypothetical protein VNQ77_05380 [Frankiaceae bacterium]|nr:hypothetical protein [Frankiaceae bacterium]